MLERTELMDNKFYEQGWCFWYRHIVVVFLPFALLIFTNIYIVLQDKYGCSLWGGVEGRHGTVAVKTLDSKFQVLHRMVLHDVEAGRYVARQMRRWILKARMRMRKLATRSLIMIVLEVIEDPVTRKVFPGGTVKPP